MIWILAYGGDSLNGHLDQSKAGPESDCESGERVRIGIHAGAVDHIRDGPRVSR